MKVCVLMGGTSEERDVSLASGAQVARALRRAGHEVLAWDTLRGALDEEDEQSLIRSGVGLQAPDPGAVDLMESGDVGALTRDPRVASADVLFPVLHGGAGEDGTLQALLDLAGLAYAGSGRVGCTLAMDKDLSKRLFRDAGISTPDWILGEREAGEVVDRLGLPLIVKPSAGGSTVGLTLVKRAGELEEAVELARGYEGEVMYEAYVEGRETTVAVLGDEALPVGEIVPAHELFDYECKYQPGMAQEIFPADLPEALAALQQEAAVRIHRLLRLRDYSRVDFIVDREGTPWCLEANALPGMTHTSLVPQAGRAAGLEFPELCDRIARLALARTRSPGGGSGAAAS